MAGLSLCATTHTEHPRPRPPPGKWCNEKPPAHHDARTADVAERPPAAHLEELSTRPRTSWPCSATPTSVQDASGGGAAPTGRRHLPSAAEDARERGDNGRFGAPSHPSAQAQTRPRARRSARGRSGRAAVVCSARIRRRRTTLALAVDGEGAAAGLGQQHVIGGDHDELALDERAGDEAPDRPAGGVPVGRLELLEGRQLGGAKPRGGWLGPAMPLKGQGARAGGARWRLL